MSGGHHKRPRSWLEALPRCPSSGKYAHPSEDSAGRQLEEIEAARGPDPLLNAYLCHDPTCASWHVGRSSPHLPPRPRKGHRYP